MSTVRVSISLPADLFEDAERLRDDEQKSLGEFYGNAIRLYLAAKERQRDDRQGAAAFRRALEGAAGVWEDHPAFRENGSAKAWRKDLWALDQVRLESSTE